MLLCELEGDGVIRIRGIPGDIGGREGSGQSGDRAQRSLRGFAFTLDGHRAGRACKKLRHRFRGLGLARSLKLYLGELNLLRFDAQAAAFPGLGKPADRDIQGAVLRRVLRVQRQVECAGLGDRQGLDDVLADAQLQLPVRGRGRDPALDRRRLQPLCHGHRNGCPSSGVAGGGRLADLHGFIGQRRCRRQQAQHERGAEDRDQDFSVHISPKGRARNFRDRWLGHRQLRYPT